MNAGGSEPLRVLLTGAAGYLGSHVHRALQAAGHEVIGADLLLEAVHGPNPVVPEGVRRLDIRDQDALDPLLDGIDVVCHLAAAVPLPRSLAPVEAAPSTASNTGAQQEFPRSNMGEHGPGRAGRRDESGGPGTGPCVRAPLGSGRPGGERPGLDGMQWAALYASHNDAGTAVLLAAMERTGVRRLVLGSSVAVYGEGRYRGARGGIFYPGLRRRRDLDRGMFDHRELRSGDVLTWEPMGEDAPLRPRSAYAASKVAQEHYGLAWVANTGGNATVLRYHHLYGEPVADGRRVRSAESGVVSRFRAELIAGRPPRVFEDGGQVRDFVHVRDAAVATVAAVERSLPGFVPLNIASGRPLTLWEVASIMAKAVDGPTPVVTGQCRVTDIRHVVAHPDRARQALEFTARTQPGKGLAEYAARGVGRR
ncbi:NAD-dependent epimerase/dehydratase family protein [Nocardia heshunensis]